MNWCEIQGNWGQLKCLLQSRWSLLTQDDLATVDAKRDNLAIMLQGRYRIDREQSERAICEFEKDVRRPGSA